MRALRIELAPRTILLLSGVVLAVWLFGQLVHVVMIVVCALVLVGTVAPLVSWLERHHFGRTRALVLVFLLGGLAFAAIALLMVPPLLAQLLDLAAEAPRTRQQLIETLQGKSWGKPLIDALQSLPLDDIGKRVASQVIGFSAALLELIGYGLTTLFLAVYVLADPVRSRGIVYALVPRRHHVPLARILGELGLIVGAYMRGQLVTSVSIGVFVFALLTAFGADNALAIALFAAFTDVIPFIGGYLAGAPVVLAVMPQGVVVVSIVAASMVVYQEFESRLLVPKIYGRTMRLSPALVLLALLIGGSLAGIIGALLALPVAAAVQMMVRELRVDLPGEAHVHDDVHERDERASEAYAALAEGVPAAQAAAIAQDLAATVKQAEDDRDRA